MSSPPLKQTTLEDAPMAARTHDERVAEFLDLASLHYGVAPGATVSSNYPDGPARRRQALRILERHPEVARANLHTAVVCGDLPEVNRRLAARPSEARENGGREGWEPLLYLCYARLPLAAAADNAVEIATALLDHGADPNCQWTYQWEQTTMAWSALCGVIGEGEGGPVKFPPHPAAEPLAALLLDRGANPNQSQALYNTMLRGDDDRWLRVLTARGLTAQDRINWSPGDAQPLFEYLLKYAVATNQLRRAAFLLEHGANANPRGVSLYKHALLGGCVEMSELLVRHGALRAEFAGHEAFRAACVRLDTVDAELMLAAHPEYIDDAAAMLVDVAAKHDQCELARLLLSFGVSPDVEYEGPSGRYRALHQAACLNHERVAQLLIDQGADVDARDEMNQASPLGWAIHAHAPATIELLARHTCDIFTLVASGQTAHLARVLAKTPERVRETLAARIGLGLSSAEAGETPLFALPGEEDSAIEVAEMLLAAGADLTKRNHAGLTAADKARARGLMHVADLLDSHAEAPRL